MSEHITKRHNKSLLLYHLVCPVKYRRDVITEVVERTLIEICKEIEKRFEINFVEIGADGNHVHFMMQSVPMMSPKQLTQTIKSVTAKEIFRLHPEIKARLWGGQFWTDGYYINTVGQYASEEQIKRYIQNQGKYEEYKQLHKSQLKLF